MLQDASHFCPMATKARSPEDRYSKVRDFLISATTSAVDCVHCISEVCVCQDHVPDILGDAIDHADAIEHAGLERRNGDDLLLLRRLRTVGHRLARSGPRPWPWGVGKGNAAGTRKALAQSHKLVLRCESRECDALVDLQSARRRARTQGRASFAAGDGCGSRACSMNFRPGQFVRRQHKMGRALQEGTRELIRWPAILTASAVWRAPACEAHAAGAKALASTRE